MQGLNELFSFSFLEHYQHENKSVLGTVLVMSYDVDDHVVRILDTLGKRHRNLLFVPVHLELIQSILRASILDAGYLERLERLLEHGQQLLVQLALVGSAAAGLVC